MILARLLGPNEFGLIGMVTTSAAHATAASIITSAGTANRVIVRAPLPL